MFAMDCAAMTGAWMSVTHSENSMKLHTILVSYILSRYSVATKKDTSSRIALEHVDLEDGK